MYAHLSAHVCIPQLPGNCIPSQLFAATPQRIAWTQSWLHLSEPATKAKLSAHAPLGAHAPLPARILQHLGFCAIILLVYTSS